MTSPPGTVALPENEGNKKRQRAVGVADEDTTSTLMRTADGITCFDYHMVYIITGVGWLLLLLVLLEPEIGISHWKVRVSVHWFPHTAVCWVMYYITVTVGSALMRTRTSEAVKRFDGYTNAFHQDSVRKCVDLTEHLQRIRAGAARAAADQTTRHSTTGGFLRVEVVDDPTNEPVSSHGSDARRRQSPSLIDP